MARYRMKESGLVSPTGHTFLQMRRGEGKMALEPTMLSHASRYSSHGSQDSFAGKAERVLNWA